MNALQQPWLQSRLLLIFVTACAGLAACRPADESNAVDANDTNEAALSVPLPQPPMDRATLLMAVARAASATAAGEDDRAAQRSLDGSRFELRIRFGCRGPAPQLREAALGWTYDQENGTLRVRAMPTISRDESVVREIVRQLDGGQIEAVEGFWIPRPWLLNSVCPAIPPPAPAERELELETAVANETAPIPSEEQQDGEAPPAASPRIGIAHFFTQTDARTRRRQMRPYEAVKTLEPGQVVGSQGFDLVLTGRIRALSGRSPIACVSNDANRPPDCVVSADFDRVWIERADTKEVLAQWGAG